MERKSFRHIPPPDPQKMNFGSAIILRCLTWFNSIDPRDPLQATDGKTGPLLRYYFLIGQLAALYPGLLESTGVPDLPADLK